MDAGKINGISPGSLPVGSTLQAVDRAADDSFEKSLKAAMDSKDGSKLKSACRQFEGIILDMMYKQMKATVVKSDLIEEDPGTSIYESMLDDSLMDEASKTGSFGLAEALYRQLSRQSGPGADSGASAGTGPIAGTLSKSTAEAGKGSVPGAVSEPAAGESAEGRQAAENQTFEK